ncbi:MAG: LuxR C-terminal-related transcriptional regulator [Caldilineaceae bacterium]
MSVCLRLKVLVTSRAPLHLYGEQGVSRRTLGLPDAKRLSALSKEPTNDLIAYAAIDLFCQRARAVKPNFALTPDNATTVAQICIGLDGLPLALELAAARIKLFSPAALLARLNQRLTLLTGGSHNLPTRQRTLRDEIAWSYALLTADEKKLFRRLAVFVGGFTLEAAQSVGNADGDLALDVMDGVATLVDHNLVKALDAHNDEARFGILETIREFGLEQLDASDEAEAVRQRHANFFLAWAEATAVLFEGANQAVVIARLTLEYANLRMALTWNQQDPNRIEMALRLANALHDFWMATGAWVEARHWFENTLAHMTKTDHTLARAQALLKASSFAVMLDDGATASLRLEEGLTIATELDAKRLMISALTDLAFIAHGEGDDALGVVRLTQALVIARESGDKLHIAESLIYLGNFARHHDDYARAHSLYEKGLTLFQELDHRFNIADTQSFLGKLAQQEGDYRQADMFFRDSLRGWRALGNVQWKGVTDCLEGLARVCAFHQQFTEAVRLLGTTEALRQVISPSYRSAIGAEISALHTQLGDAVFAAVWAEGRALSAEQAIDYALALPTTPALPFLPGVHEPAPLISSTYPAGLTAREVEVLRLLTQGLTYAQIADQLIVSRRTVNAHATSIYSKLGVTSRAMATRLAIEQNLV